MKIYLDLIFFINFSFDFLLLLTVKILLKRNIKLYRIIIGSLVGGLSIFLLFIKLNSFTLFLLKLLISFIMIIISFGYKDKKYYFKNTICLYTVSILLGGFLYCINSQLSYRNVGLVFIKNNYSINYILLLILSPIVLYLYIKQNKELKNNEFYYKVSFIYKNKKYIYNAFLDTGNSLYDPYTKTPVILVFDKSIKIEKPIYIPFHNINGNGMIKAFKINSFFINEKRINKKVIVALVDDSFKIDGINLLLHKDLL